jgi:hypothetical protein
MSINCNSREKGSALLLAVLAALVLAVTGIGAMGLGSRGRMQAIRISHDIEARCAADAGLSKAVYEMNEMLAAGTLGYNNLPYTTNESVPNTQCSFSYKVGTNDDGDYVVESVGTCGQTVKTVACTLRFKGLFEYSILARSELTLKSGTTVDSYGSGPVDAHIATTSTSDDQIILNKGVVVNGDVFVGVGSSPVEVIKDLGATTGRRGSMSEEIEFPRIMPPSLADSGKIEVKGTTLTIGPGDTGKYSSIQLSRSDDPGILEISGGDVELHVTGDVDMGQDCEIIINEGASLTIYLEGDLVAANNSGFNNRTKISKKFALYGTAEGEQAMDIKAKSDLFGVVYAPNAVTYIYSSGDVFGSVVCRKFELKSGSDFYYDKSLRESSSDDPGVRFSVERWSEQ